MNLYLTLFTHLCVHLLGLMGNTVLALIFAIVSILIYWLHLRFIRAFWPGQILPFTLARIEAMEARLHDEAARRRTMEMYNLSTYGLRALAVLKGIHDGVAKDHCAHLHSPLSYIRVALSLCRRARQCKHDVEALCRELDAKIQRDHGNYGSNTYQNDIRGEDTAQSASWFDMVLAALS
ncbi:hypothetical protein B0H19DRAFT_1255797 [Mycena capillaripes]|nr:hypothetical protein B0H19DRAFT_1255797 [Mycena capillaripes]